MLKIKEREREREESTNFGVLERQRRNYYRGKVH
jgi:hypothetical protein